MRNVWVTRARENSSHSQPYVSWAVERGGAGVVITAVVVADMIWIIVHFLRKRTFDCSRSGSAIGPFTQHNGPSGVRIFSYSGDYIVPKRSLSFSNALYTAKFHRLWAVVMNLFPRAIIPF